ncbi:MAG: hypothetical protein ACM3W8_03900 [Sideroxydans sp.]
MVRWHLSQESAPLRPLLWLDGFPVAIRPLWHVTHEPGPALP